MNNPFEILANDAGSHARSGVLYSRRGTVQTPVFMPVGTQAAVKTLTADEVRRTGSSIILANTYHLLLRPGPEVLSEAGGVHRFMNWNGPLLTDSGGYQVFSLASRRKIRERGIEFRSHLDGQKLDLTPESAIDLQIGYGSDIMMPLDVLAGYDAPPAEQTSAAERTLRWLERSVDHFRNAREGDDQPGLLFGICQGGFDTSRRREHARSTARLNSDGFSIGGLSVGESKAELFQMLEASLESIPWQRPRYLMGVGSPEDLWQAVFRGVDMFDCVHPTRVARRGALFTRDGRVNITASRYKRQFAPLEDDCDCESCRTYSAAYLHHLFRTGEMLGPRLATIHNIRFMHRMTAEMRAAIHAGTFAVEHDRFLARYARVDERVSQEQRYRWREHQERKRAESGS